MEREDLIFVGVCDLAGHLRGKAFPARDLESRLRKGMGYTGANIMMSAFGPIYDNPFGTIGDLTLVPDPSTKVDVTFPGSAAERFYLADIRTPEGARWECCPRHFLRRALDDLRETAGLQILSAFEQELVYTGVDAHPGTTYGYDSFRHQQTFGEAFIAAIRRAGVTPDSFLPEYAPRQYEVTVAPTLGMRAADEAVIVREMAKGVAFRLGNRVILSPTVDFNGVGNGTHIHFSLCGADGRPVMHDPSRPYGLSTTAEPFVAGILHHLPALAALTAPSIVSYFRLRPNRWAPVWANLAERDRGAALRVCAVVAAAPEDAAHQFNVEYRVSDATASPYMALGAIVHAGVDGIRKAMKLAGARAGSACRQRNGPGLARPRTARGLPAPQEIRNRGRQRSERGGDLRALRGRLLTVACRYRGPAPTACSRRCWRRWGTLSAHPASVGGAAPRWSARSAGPLLAAVSFGGPGRVSSQCRTRCPQG